MTTYEMWQDDGQNCNAGGNIVYDSVRDLFYEKPREHIVDSTKPQSTESSSKNPINSSTRTPTPIPKQTPIKVPTNSRKKNKKITHNCDDGYNEHDMYGAEYDKYYD